MLLLFDLLHEERDIFLYFCHKRGILGVEERLFLKHIDDIDSETADKGAREVIDTSSKSIPIHTSSSLRATEDRRYTRITQTIRDDIRYDAICKKRLLFLKNLFYLIFL